MTRALLRIRTIADRDTACRWARQAPIGSTVEFKAPRRSTEQNALLWALLHDISRQLVWYGEKLTADEVKDLLTAGLKKSRVVPGVDGGFVVLGMRTSSLTKQEFSELIELAYAFGAKNGIKFSGDRYENESDDGRDRRIHRDGEGIHR